MRVALVQDWLIVNGGAEKVFKEMAACFPDADIFSLVEFLTEEDRASLINGRPVKTSFLQYFPFAKKIYRNFLPLFPIAISSLDFSKYDLIISSSYAVAKGLKKKTNQIHLCYCHSPIRYAWDLKDEYLANLGGVKRWISELILRYIRSWDLKTASYPNLYIANSTYIADRIKRTYGKDAVVLHPPINTKKFTPHSKKQNYYFTSARLVPYKKIDLIVNAFNEIPSLRLIVSGDGPEFEQLKSLGKENIEFTGFLKQNELVKYMQEAKAFVLAANEDFGITSLEAQSCLTPVIALRKGGYLETVKENKTGVFFEEQTVESIKQAILDFEKSNIQWQSDAFEKNVEQFSVENFRIEFDKIVSQYVKK